jgi:hypothetical protein
VRNYSFTRPANFRANAISRIAVCLQQQNARLLLGRFLPREVPDPPPQGPRSAPPSPRPPPPRPPVPRPRSRSLSGFNVALAPPPPSGPVIEEL